MQVDAAEHQTLTRTIRRIRRLITAGHLDRARTELTVDLRVYPDHPLLLSLAAILYTSLGEFERADGYWEQVAEIAGHHHEVESIRGGVLLRLGAIEQAEELLNRSNTKRPYQPLTVFHLVCLYEATDRIEQAAPLLKAMSALQLTEIIGWLENDHETLLTFLDKESYLHVVELALRGGEGVPRPFSTELHDGYLPLSPAGEDIGNLLGREARELDQDIERLRQRLNRANVALTRFENAIRNGQWHDAAYIGTHPGMARSGLTAPAFRAMAQYARFMTGEEDEAIRELQRLRHQSPDSLFAALHLAEALLMSGRPEKALNALSNMDVRYPRHTLETVLRACAHAESGRTEAALQRLELLGEYAKAAVSRWFLSHAPYQNAILNDNAYAIWRGTYLVEE